MKCPYLLPRVQTFLQRMSDSNESRFLPAHARVSWRSVCWCSPSRHPFLRSQRPLGLRPRAWKHGLSATIPAYGACWACSAWRGLRGYVGTPLLSTGARLTPRSAGPKPHRPPRTSPLPTKNMKTRGRVPQPWMRPMRVQRGPIRHSLHSGGGNPLLATANDDPRLASRSQGPRRGRRPARQSRQRPFQPCQPAPPPWWISRQPGSPP